MGLSGNVDLSTGFVQAEKGDRVRTLTSFNIFSRLRGGKITSLTLPIRWQTLMAAKTSIYGNARVATSTSKPASRQLHSSLFPFLSNPVLSGSNAYSGLYEEGREELFICQKRPFFLKGENSEKTKGPRRNIDAGYQSRKPIIHNIGREK